MARKKKMSKLKRAVIKEELVVLTGDDIAALALNQFLYWSERTEDTDKFLEEEKQRNPSLDIEPTYGWIYKTIEQLHEELMFQSASEATLRRRVDYLVKEGWLDRRSNPKYRWDRTWQYRPNIIKIQTDLFKLGYALEGYPLQLDKSILHGEKWESHDETSNMHGEPAVPEITTEITTETNGAFLKEEKRKPTQDTVSIPNNHVTPIVELPKHDYLHDALNLAQKQQPIHELRQRILEALANAMDRELPDDAFFLKDWENARDALIGQCQTIAKKERREDKLHQEIESAIYTAKQADGWQFGDADYPTKAILHRIVRAYREREWTIPLADPYAGVKEL